MIKVILVICMGMSLGVNAQSFTIPSDTAKGAIYSYMDLHSNITNISSAPIKITWKVIDSDFPNSWKTDTVLGICDNMLCRANVNNQLFTQTFTTDDYLPNQEGDFHVQLTKFSSPNIESGSHYLTVELKDATTTKNVTFIVTKFPTGIIQTQKVENTVQIFPNPATGQLCIMHEKQPIGNNAITVYNTNGIIILHQNTTEQRSYLNLQNISAGVYFIKISDEFGNVKAFQRIIKQ